MTSTDALISDLSSRLAPVRRRSVHREAAWLLALGSAELALLLVCGAARPDMGRVILSSFMVWKIGGFTVLAVAGCTVAVRSFAPPSSPRPGLALLPGLAALMLIGIAFVTNAAESSRPLMERLAPAQGVRCVAAIVLLSLPVMVLLAVLMRRAAPVRPAWSAGVAGVAASTSGALVFAACCPMNDPLYIAVWYSVGVAIVTAAARWLLPRRFRL